MPPLHPAFVHFPIALVVFSFIGDLLNRLFSRPSLRAVESWSLLGALVFGAITAATGYYDMVRTRSVLGDTSGMLISTWTSAGCWSGPWWLVRRRNGLFTRRGSGSCGHLECAGIVTTCRDGDGALDLPSPGGEFKAVSTLRSATALQIYSSAAQTLNYRRASAWPSHER